MTVLDGNGGTGSPPETGMVTSLASAVRAHIHARDTIHVAYADGRPNAALHEILRQWHGRDSQFTLVTAGLASTNHALIEAGIVTKVVASFAGENFPTARPNRAFQRAVAAGRVTVESWSLWSLMARLIAGALGVPFLPIRSLAGSGMAQELAGRGYLDIEAAGTRTGAVTALRPDVVVLQAVAADELGNVVLSAPYGEGLWGTMAARRGVIVCAERVVDTDQIRQHAALVKIPAHAVLAVCEVPFGSHPYGLYNPGFPGVSNYLEDEEFIDDARRASESAEDFQRWIDTWILGTGDHAGYLQQLGAAKLTELRVPDDIATWQPDAPAYAGPLVTPSERMIVLAAREIGDRVRGQGHDAMLAGVGQANLAAWLASRTLNDDGVAIELMAEIGMFGYTPQPGDPFIFSKRNLPTSRMLTDVMGVLGAFVGGPGTSTIGVVGAGQIAANGDINSTWSADGTYLVGSGGANDVGAADDVLVTVAQSRRRLVPEVPYVTVPGTRINTVVTDRAVFRRDNDQFVLAGVVGEGDRHTVESVRRGIGWDNVRVAAQLKTLPEPSSRELSLLRSFDPARRFLGTLPYNEEETA